MPPFRHFGPICQTKDWHEELDSGTLPRVPATIPADFGSKVSAEAAPRKAIASGKCSFVNPVPRGTVHVPKAAFDRLRKDSPQAKIVPPATQPKTGDTTIEQYIEIGNQKIKVIRPTDDLAKGKNLPTMAQLAEALRAVPAVQREQTNTVVLSPNPSPDSTPTQTIGGEGGSGQVELYPVPDTQTQEDWDNRLTHETGHNYEEKVWGGAAGVHEWDEAAKADDRPPSPYARKNAGEDFAEFSIIYHTAKGTSCEAIARKIYPNRWAKMDGY
jgi:hypothetical protein